MRAAEPGFPRRPAQSFGEPEPIPHSGAENDSTVAVTVGLTVALTVTVAVGLTVTVAIGLTITLDDTDLDPQHKLDSERHP